MMTESHEWMTLQQAAEYMQVSTRTVHRWIKAGRLRIAQVVPGGLVRVSAVSIEKMLEKSRH